MMEIPQQGSPCNRCGACCQAILCMVAQVLLNKITGPCPLIETGADGLPACGLVEHPERYVPSKIKEYGRDAVIESVRVANSFGLGCDYRPAGRPPNKAFRQLMYDHQMQHVDKYENAKKIWDLPLKTGADVVPPHLLWRD